MGVLDFLLNGKKSEEVKRVEVQGDIALPEGKLLIGDILEKIKEVGSESVDLCFTSPPYNLGIRYDGNGASDRRKWDEYFGWCEQWISEVYRVLKAKGFFVLNVPMSVLEFKGRKSAIPVGSVFIELGLKSGFEYYGTAVWDKGMITAPLFNRLKYDTTTTNPPFYETYELIIIFKKPTGKVGREDKPLKLFSPADYINFSYGIWRITPEVKFRFFHPAPFPYELAFRVVNLFTTKGEVVLDCFAGTGTTLIASAMEGRKFIGIEKSRAYASFFLSEYNAWKEKIKFLTKKENNGIINNDNNGEDDTHRR